MLSSSQIKELSRLSLDLGKIIFGSGVIGFFFPIFSKEVSGGEFAVASIVSGVLFVMGIKLSE